MENGQPEEELESKENKPIKIESITPSESIEEELPPEFIEAEVESEPIESIERMRTRVGLWLCVLVIILIGLESITILTFFFIDVYSLKSLAEPLTEQSIKAYRDARGAMVEDVLKIGNMFLGSVLLPVLTLLLGYMFGSRKEKEDAEEGD